VNDGLYALLIKRSERSEIGLQMRECQGVPALDLVGGI
jgi:hypothetical protein